MKKVIYSVLSFIGVLVAIYFITHFPVVEWFMGALVWFAQFVASLVTTK